MTPLYWLARLLRWYFTRHVPAPTHDQDLEHAREQLEDLEARLRHYST